MVVVEVLLVLLMEANITLVVVVVQIVVKVLYVDTGPD